MRTKQTTFKYEYQSPQNGPNTFALRYKPLFPQICDTNDEEKHMAVGLTFTGEKTKAKTQTREHYQKFSFNAPESNFN